MLVPASLYESELKDNFIKLFGTNDYFYYAGATWLYELETPRSSEYEDYFWASVDEDTVVGYLSYRIVRSLKRAKDFGILSFDRHNVVFSHDLAEVLRNVLYHSNLDYVEFRMIDGNPVKPHYEKLVNRFNHVHNILHQTCIDFQGNFHDEHIYEIELTK